MYNSDVVSYIKIMGGLQKANPLAVLITAKIVVICFSGHTNWFVSSYPLCTIWDVVSRLLPRTLNCVYCMPKIQSRNRHFISIGTLPFSLALSLSVMSLSLFLSLSRSCHSKLLNFEWVLSTAFLKASHVIRSAARTRTATEGPPDSQFLNTLVLWWPKSPSVFLKALQVTRLSESWLQNERIRNRYAWVVGALVWLSNCLHTQGEESLVVWPHKVVLHWFCSYYSQHWL